jgi:hypothetical protein
MAVDREARAAPADSDDARPSPKFIVPDKPLWVLATIVPGRPIFEIKISLVTVEITRSKTSTDRLLVQLLRNWHK